MVHITRKIRARYNGEKDYLPEGIPENEWLQVVGYETRRRTQMKGEGDKRHEVVVEDIYYLVISNGGKLTALASFNCQTTIDRDELSVNSIAQTIGAIASMIKESKLSEHVGQLALLMTQTSSEGMLNVVTHQEGG